MITVYLLDQTLSACSYIHVPVLYVRSVVKKYGCFYPQVLYRENKMKLQHPSTPPNFVLQRTATKIQVNTCWHAPSNTWQLKVPVLGQKWQHLFSNSCRLDSAWQTLLPLLQHAHDMVRGQGNLCNARRALGCPANIGAAEMDHPDSLKEAALLDRWVCCENAPWKAVLSKTLPRPASFHDEFEKRMPTRSPDQVQRLCYWRRMH